MTENNDKSGTEGDKYQRPDADAVLDEAADMQAELDSAELDPIDASEANDQLDSAPESAQVAQKMPSRLPGYLGLPL